MPSPNTPVVFILSTNFAGSTALGLALGSHQKTAFMGEPNAIVRKKADGSYRNRKFCSLCDDEDGASCPVWSAKTIELVRNNPDDTYARYGDLYASWNGLDAVADPILVDASKDLPWLDARRKSGLIVPYIVHISKTVESFAASIITRRENPFIEEIAQNWAVTNREIRDYASQHAIPYIHVRYDDFALHFDDTMTKICRLLGLSFDPLMREFWAHEHHFVKGNPGTATHFARKKDKISHEPGVNKEVYAENHQTIFLDEKWKKLLQERDVHRLYALPEVRQESMALGYRNPFAAENSPADLPYRLYGQVLSTAFPVVSRAVKLPTRVRTRLLPTLQTLFK